MVFKFSASLLEDILLRTNSAKTEVLSLGDGTSTMSGMATVCRKILVGVRWLHVQVGLNEAIP